ncbi:hypothetical protein NP493_567g01001 [Ridgeia piscesae]|uniref:G-protein coupled receptors family 1 profile domain-containing protein n=1 Tax=Ridgeia piscesae TaxID=27915 RepID=A0AAD9NRJ9_RIDPI|nr:hypothetical protein NP493_567g01001 [Ridgeia piscesae]
MDVDSGQNLSVQWPAMVTPVSSLCGNSSMSLAGCPVEPGGTGSPHTDLPLVRRGEMWTPEVVQRIVTLAVIMTLTLFGNVIIILVLTCSKYRRLNRRVNVFIINLAVGDLTVCCFTMTTEVLFVVFDGAWVLGAAACKILLYVQIITLASTTFILVAMSADRYMAICRPLSFGTTTSSRARKMIAVSWLMAFVFATPQLLIFKQVDSGVYPNGDIKRRCVSEGYTDWWQRKLYFTFLATYILVIPGTVISYCYINVVRVVWRQGKNVTDRHGGVALRKTQRDAKAIPRAKIRTVKMTLAIICSFIMCWTPYFVVHLIHIWSEYRVVIPGPVYVFAETMALLNSVLNPVIYGCFNMRLARGIVEVFCPARAARRQQQLMRQTVGVTENDSTDENNRAVVRFGRKGEYAAVGRTNEPANNAHRNGFHLRVRAVRKNRNYDVCTNYLARHPGSPCRGYNAHTCRV